MPPEAGPDPTEARMKAFDFAADAAKQLITVTTAVVAFAAVLLTEFVSRPEVVQRGLFAAAMVAYLASIVLGLLAIFNMADELDEPDPQPPSIKHQRVSGYLGWQMGTFAVATGLIVVFAITAVMAPDEPAPTPQAAPAAGAEGTPTVTAAA
jgi:hypothetical protein